MSRTSPARRVARVMSRVGLGACLLMAGGMLALPLLGYERYVITGGSMGETIERGSVIWAKAVPTADLKVGDVITYTPPRGSGPEGMVTHRIMWIGRDPSGSRLFRTKGDGNASADPWRFRLDNPKQAKVAFHLPKVGYALAAASDRKLRTVAVGLMALLVVMGTFGRLWHDAGESMREGSPA